MAHVNTEATVECIERNRDVIVGVKALLTKVRAEPRPAQPSG